VFKPHPTVVQATSNIVKNGGLIILFTDIQIYVEALILNGINSSYWCY